VELNTWDVTLLKCCQLEPAVYQSIPPFVVEAPAEAMTFTSKCHVLELEGI
jgi:hypothetical protein